MKSISFFFLSVNFQFLEVKVSIYLKRRVFVMSHLLCFRHLSEIRFLIGALHKINKFANISRALMQSSLS